MTSGLSPSRDTRRRIAALFAAGVTAPPAPRPRWLRRGRLDLVAVADVIAALICFAATNSRLGDEHPTHAGSAVILLISLAVSAPLAVRNFLPVTAWSASALAMLLVGGSYTPMGILPAGVLVYILCLYAVAVRCEAWVVTTAGVVTAVGALFVEGQPPTTAVLVAAVPVLAGVVVRTRRSNRQRLAVQERRHEGERALLEERQRIARELHDVVAHHMSVIAIQAEAAPYKTPDPPKELVESFAEIRASALSGLHELRRVLGVLRSDTPDTAPQPGLADLDTLLESARSAAATLSGLTAADIGLGRDRWLPGRLGSGLAAGAGAGWLLIAVVPATRPLLGDERAAGLDGRAVAYQALVRIPIGTAVWEETAFRGVLQAALRRVMSDTAAIVVTSAAFGLWHIRPTLQALRVNGLAATRRQAVTGTCAGVAGTAAAGALLSWLRARSGRLAAPVLLHVATNSGGLIAAHAVAAHRRRHHPVAGLSA
jgi:membrane protease YdiL (CAAX protease family)